MGSYDARKVSTESLEVSLQDSNIISNFRDDFRFLCMGMQTLLMQKVALRQADHRPAQGQKLHHSEKMSIFQSLLYFHHNVTTGKGTSYQG